MELGEGQDEGAAASFESIFHVGYFESILVTAVARQVCSQIEERMIYVSTTLFNTLTSLKQDSYVGVRKYISRLYPYTNKTEDSGGKMERIIFSETL